MFKIKLLIIPLIVIINITYSNAQSYEDKRCKCICPSINSVLNNNSTDENDHMLIIENVVSRKCDCAGAILPRIGDKIKGKELEFCPRCQCQYENRNTTIIKVVVIIVIWVISLLVVYMLFLICLDPLLNKRVKANYQEHTNEEDDTVTIDPPTSTLGGSSTGASAVSSSSVPTSSHAMGVRGHVLNRVGHQQDKWKRQVREQRRNIYDRHTMLN